MKCQKITALVLALALSPLISSCAAWQKDPTGMIAQVLSVVTTVVQSGVMLFGQIKPHLPEDQQASAQAKFDGAVATILQTKATIEGAVKVANDTGGTLDVSKLVADLSSEGLAIQQLISEFQKLVAPTVSKYGEPSHTAILASSNRLLGEYAQHFNPPNEPKPASSSPPK